MVWQAAAITAGANLAGSLYQQRQARKRANEQMAFQADMSNTAYQRAVKDMRKAGINPIMASKLGGASTPSGAMAPTPDFGSIGTKAMNAYQQGQQLKLTNAQVDNTVSQTELNSAKKFFEETKTKNQELQNSILEKNIKKAGKLSEWEVKYTPFNQAGSQLLNLFSNAFRENPNNPNWNRVINNITADPRQLMLLLKGEHQINKLPKNQQKEALRKKLKKEIQSKNLTWDEFKVKGKQILNDIFGRVIFK